MRKAAIPQVRTTDPYLYAFLAAIKENVELITGVRGGQVQPLPTNATQAQIIDKINEIVARINYSA